MFKSDFLLFAILVLVVVGAALGVWLDFLIPRAEKRDKMEGRDWEQLRAKIRFRVSMDFWNMRKTRKLTDQRRVKDRQPD